jgi:hypothetical protein
MGWEHELGHSASVHTCHTPGCVKLEIGASAADILYNQTLSKRKSHTSTDATQMTRDASRNDTN